MALSKKTGLAIVAAVLLLGGASGLVIPIVYGRLMARRGASQALADIDSGELRYWQGYPHRRALRAARDLEAKYDVKVFFKDTGTHYEFMYWGRYNAEIRRHLTARHGRDVISEVLNSHRPRAYEAEPQRAADAASHSDGRDQ